MVFLVLTNRCLVAAFNGGHCPSSGFPNYPRSQLRPTVSRPVCLGANIHLGPKTGWLLLSDSFGFVDVWRSLWREDGSIVYNCCWPSPAQSLGSESLWIRDHILLTQIRDFPFRRLLRLVRSQWRYSAPPPHCPRVTRRRSSHIFLDNRLTYGGEVVSLMNRLPFTQRKVVGAHFC
jgi:hypothetical protein